MNDTKVGKKFINLDVNTSSSTRQNWLRAAVLGANDGIVSVAALVVGVAGASSSSSSIFLVGIAGLVAGALSMSVGEYVSVSSQRDTENALLDIERFELENYPEQELEELVQIYEGKGLKRETAEVVAKELTDHDAFAAHAYAELGIDPNELTNPGHAALASAISFAAGALIPLLAITIPPAGIRVPVAFAAVLLALFLTGLFSAHISGSSKIRAAIRVVVGGTLAMGITYGVGMLFGVSGI
jgi:VIT1/CCC1 family predicted Fe2+/Mn2+ transporter